jgi:hypothetical protein
MSISVRGAAPFPNIVSMQAYLSPSGIPAGICVKLPDALVAGGAYGRALHVEVFVDSSGVISEQNEWNNITSRYRKLP